MFIPTPKSLELSTLVENMSLLEVLWIRLIVLFIVRTLALWLLLNFHQMDIGLPAEVQDCLNHTYLIHLDASGKVRVWSWDNPEHLTKLETPVFNGEIKDLDWDSESKKIVAVGDGSHMVFN